MRRTMPKKKIEFKTPRTCTKTRNVPGCNDRNYPLLEEWEVALDDLCDLFGKMKKARAFLTEWVKGADYDPRSQEGDSQDSFKAIAAYKFDCALYHLLAAECDLQGAWITSQERAYERFQEQTKTRSPKEYRRELLKEEGVVK